MNIVYNFFNCTAGGDISIVYIMMDRVSPQNGVHAATVQFSLRPTVAVRASRFLLAVSKGMKLIRFLIIVLVLVVSPCLGELVIATSRWEKSTLSLVNELGKILKSCYGDQINGVGLAGNLPRTLSRTLTVQHLLPVVLIDRDMDVNNMPRHLTKDFQYKLHVFIIEGYSTEQLDRLIGRTMKSSVWWNHMASFFIIDLSRGCGNAKEFLLIAWKNDMLNAKVMCGPRRGERSIFNYNPFTSQAPFSWQRVEVFPGTRRQSFTLLNQKYQENETICADLNFDKTKEFGGYRVLLEGRKRNKLKVGPLEVRNEGQEFHTIRQNILKNVYRALNLTARYNGQEREWDVITETDMIAHTVRVYNPVHRKMSYLTGTVGRGIITQFRKREPRRFNESFTFRDIDTRFGSPVVFLITLFAFKFFVDQALVPILINLIRVTCNKSFINRRNINTTRLYLTNAGFFVVMMQAIFYADLTYPLTKQVPIRNVETVKDLVDLGYTKVVGHEDDQYYYPSVGPKNVFVFGNTRKCLSLLRNRSSMACMDDLFYILDRVEKFNLHLNREFHEAHFESFPIRSNWPLEERVNTMIARSVEASVLEPWFLKFNLVKSRILRKGETDRKNNKTAESINLAETTFVFIFLAIGHTCAAVVFIIEVLSVCRCRFKMQFIRRYWHVTVKKNGYVSLTSTLDSTV